MAGKRTAEFAGSVAFGAWTAFAVLALVVTGLHGAPLGPDRTLLDWSLAHRPDVAVAVARGITATGTGVVPYALVVAAGVAVGRTRRQRLVAALLGAGCLALGQTARSALMELVGRARPPQADWQTSASGWSFPSGHSTTAALAAGLLILALRWRAPHGRTPWCVAVACWGPAVGATRVFLGVHWCTDVLGGWLFAVGWLGICVYAAARWVPRAWVPDDVPERPVAAP
ncbi:phosphatase PAP2 family protein [Streptomyces sp. NPDC058464]|uniref:phosphatase PAP2 family protein n=1 Tax=Streptomyces sp. NPDC058464 TaxID=3346511 RepID=UPI0036514E10